MNKNYFFPKRLKIYTLLFLLVIISISSYAHCDLEKAGRNKILNHKIGVSGKCNAETAIKNEVTKKADKALNIDTRKNTEIITTIKSKAADSVAEIKNVPGDIINNISESER